MTRLVQYQPFFLRGERILFSTLAGRHVFVAEKTSCCICRDTRRHAQMCAHTDLQQGSSVFLTWMLVFSLDSKNVWRVPCTSGGDSHFDQEVEVRTQCELQEHWSSSLCISSRLPSGPCQADCFCDPCCPGRVELASSHCVRFVPSDCSRKGNQQPLWLSTEVCQECKRSGLYG